MRLAILARADRGGLAAQTYEVHRNLQPSRVLVVDLGERGRGPSNPARYESAPALRVTNGLPEHDDLVWLCTDVDVILTFETAYRSTLMDIAAKAGVPVVVVANPELWRPEECPGAIPVLPTTWESERFPGVPVLPMPVARDRLERRVVTSVSTFLHLWAPAFHDRNGTGLTLAACEHVREECRLVIRAPASETYPSRIGKVTILHNVTEHEDYAQAWPDSIDALVLPRRYGGLSLPMNEAASLGLPIVSLDLPPQRSWLPPATLVPVDIAEDVRMKGGTFRVYGADPRLIAARMDALVAEPALAQACAKVSDAYASRISWDRLRGEWLGFLSLVADGELVGVAR